MWISLANSLRTAFPFWAAAFCLWAFTVADLLMDFIRTYGLPWKQAGQIPPNYGPPEALRRKNKPQESFDAYRELSRRYPNEVKPWVEMIRLAYLEFKDDDLASTVHEEGLQALKGEARKQELQKMYKAITSMTQTPLMAEEVERVPYRS